MGKTRLTDKINLFTGRGELEEKNAEALPNGPQQSDDTGSASGTTDGT